MSAQLQHPIDDAVWSAMGDPTRRRLLDALLAEGVGTATTLSRDLPVTRQAVTKHLEVLERAALVRSEPVGRERHFTIDDVQLERAAAQLAAVGSAWEGRLSRIRKLAESIHQRSTQSQAPTVPPDERASGEV